jgi:hypothetical protein
MGATDSPPASSCSVPLRPSLRIERWIKVPQVLAVDDQNKRPGAAHSLRICSTGQNQVVSLYRLASPLAAAADQHRRRL